MKKKVISGLTWTFIGLVIISFPFSHLMSFIIAAFAAIADYELVKCSGLKNKKMIVLSMVVSGIIPVIIELREHLEGVIKAPGYLFLVPYIIILFCFMLSSFETTKFDQFLMTLFGSCVMPFVFSSILLVRDSYRIYGFDSYTKSNCFFMIFAGLLCAWMTDAMAYFVGSKFGKRKLAPKISPKKSVEGAVGGVILTAVINVIVWFVFWLLARYDVITPLIFPIWFVPIASVVFSILGILGDLSFSVVKRSYGIKDFGIIMGEGNGGVMDRFDSFSFVLPAIYFTVTFYEAYAA